MTHKCRHNHSVRFCMLTAVTTVGRACADNGQQPSRSCNSTACREQQAAGWSELTPSGAQMSSPGCMSIWRRKTLQKASSSLALVFRLNMWHLSRKNCTSREEVVTPFSQAGVDLQDIDLQDTTRGPSTHQKGRQGKSCGSCSGL